MLLFSRLHQGAPPWSMGTLLLAGAIVILRRASHVQWTFYVKYRETVFERRSDGRLADCCQSRGVDADTLRALGVGSPA